MLNDRRRDRTERPFPRDNVVRRRWNITKSIARARDAEVVHLVVEDDARFRYLDQKKSQSAYRAAERIRPLRLTMI